MYARMRVWLRLLVRLIVNVHSISTQYLAVNERTDTLKQRI